MIPVEIQRMKRVPGLYALYNFGSALYVIVHVDRDGAVHQCTPKLVRDGVLGDDHWHPLATYSPLPQNQ